MLLSGAMTGSHRQLTLLLALALVFTGCRDRRLGEVRLMLGPRSEDTVAFELKTALAEYVAIEGSGDELRLMLSNYEGVDCDGFVPPKAGEYLVTVTATSPVDHPLAKGDFPWRDSVPVPEDAGAAPTARQAIPSARSIRGSHLIQPGGYLRLTDVELAPYGAISGLLAFDYPGGAAGPATSINGRFAARLCRFLPRSAKSP